MTGAGCIFRDQLDASPIEGGDDLGQSIDHASHVPFARLHALDRRQRHARQIGQRLLVNAKQSAAGAHASAPPMRPASCSSWGITPEIL